MSGFKEITGGERGRWEGVENLSEFYYKEEQRQSGNFQKKWDQGFFFPLKMSSLLLFFFFRQETEQLVFTKLGMIPKPSQK